jgi:hypothetical protein
MKTYDVTQAPGIVTQAGTPLNAANLNALETGLQATASTMDTHIALQTTVHGSTSAATANKLVHRDANGRAKVAAPSASDDIARLDTVEASRPYVSGSYTGDGSATRDIALSFTPSAVWVYPKYAMPSSSTYPTSGLAVTGSPAQAAAGVAAVAVGTTKFTVSYSTSGNDGRTNENAVVFHYIAFK